MKITFIIIQESINYEVGYSNFSSIEIFEQLLIPWNS